MSGDPKKVNYALQGGGAHGAFGWGVLDYLLEDGRVSAEGICATSAGAMNAVVMAYGLSQSGPDLAREKLEAFWRGISTEGWPFAMGAGVWGQDFEDWTKSHVNTAFTAIDALTRLMSPYDYNPLNINPLRDVLERVVDFEALQKCPRTKLFICATNVRTGRVKVFRTPEITADAVLASACLPHLFQAVEIKGEAYWDGGYVGNPALWPLFYEAGSRDVVVVHLNPLERPEVPQRPSEIMNRINEISFNSSLLREMRAIAFVQRLVEDDMLKDEFKDSFKDVLFHSIRADKMLCDLSVASKYNTNWMFLQDLKERGRETAKSWLDEVYDKLGRESSVDLRADFLAE